MFHVELRQFPHQARAFNLTVEELQARIISPWAAGQPVQLQDRRWDPARAKLAVYEGREMATDEIGMGRGWATVTREGDEVTERVLEDARQALRSPPALDELKAEILTRADQTPVSMALLLDVVAQVQSDLSATERVDLARRAIWELLEDGSLELSRAASS
ncbi:MAG TPA: hypothetical protein VGH93_14290 [Solirubrobacteraceae bacterium]